ncbi:MAG: hypothetical protein CBB69_012775 [Phycisphaera sp. TMED9]|nr:MAG: hypothetical protein CBB69_012775 [Phycisphaera sp. TMED9]
MAPTPPEARRWTARRIISVAILAFLFILVFALAGPGWWRFTPSGDSTAQQGNDIEQMIVGRVTRVRDSEEPWGFVIDDDVVNVWLATRLVPWLEHEGDAELPEGWSDPQVRFGADVIQVGIGSPWYGVVVTDFRPRLEDESVVLELVGTSAGWIPIPSSMAASLVPAFGSDLENGTEASMDGIRVPRAFDLADGRSVWIEDIEVASGELGLRFRTRR